jgi:hypothetical protein
LRVIRFLPGEGYRPIFVSSGRIGILFAFVTFFEFFVLTTQAALACLLQRPGDGPRICQKAD